MQSLYLDARSTYEFDSCYEQAVYLRSKFVYIKKISDNKLAQSCSSFACSDANSIIGNKIAYFRNEYNIFAGHNTFSEEVSLIKKTTQLCEELQLTIIDHIW